MKYLGDKNIKEIRLDWKQNINTIEAATQCIATKDISQPLKPYLRYKDLKNRIIAMPAYVGGEINRSGIKWIASFPENTKKGLARAHSVIILNDAETGKPVSVINSGSISAIRTASVSGLIVRKYLELNRQEYISLGICGFGPIGQYHLDMCISLLGDRLKTIRLYDLKEVSEENIPLEFRNKVEIVSSWEDAYTHSDIFITCTVSKEPYIDLPPKASSLHLNVSLRDYKPSVFEWFAEGMIVDDWNEVCRENTDIETFHKVKGLTENQANLIQDVLNGFMETLDKDQAIMFNPMGMAVYDMAIANYYLSLANKVDVGVQLEV